MTDDTTPQDDAAMPPASAGYARVVTTGRSDDKASGITARQLFESLTQRQQLFLLKAVGCVPKWVLTGNAIQRAAAAPVVLVRAYRTHRSDGMKVGEAVYWAWKLAQAFCF